jgi:hypothetical protein
MIYEYGKPRWKYIDRGIARNSEKNLFHYVHQKSNID